MSELPLPTQTPSLADVITAGISSRLNGLRVALPARCESYDKKTRSGTFQPLVMEGFFDPDGVRQVERLPSIPDVPVVMPSGGGFRLVLPVRAGDIVLLVFSSSSLDQFLRRGGAEVDPEDDRRHSLSDAVAIVGLFTLGGDGGDLPPDGTLLIGGMTASDGPHIEIDASEIRAGGTTPLVKTTEYDGHTHSFSWTGNDGSGHPMSISGTTGGADSVGGTAKLRG